MALTNGGVIITWGAEHRDSFCNDCGTHLVNDPKISAGSKKVNQNFCSACGDYRLGHLIVRQSTVRPPDPPTCLKIGCVLKYLRDSLAFALIVNYHQRRVRYAEKNRGKKILERYRTGEPSPKTLWQAMHANMKLTCPVCRKYNVDPFLFGGKHVAQRT